LIRRPIQPPTGVRANVAVSAHLVTVTGYHQRIAKPVTFVDQADFDCAIVRDIIDMA